MPHSRVEIMIPKINRFSYPGTNRELIEGKRHYIVGKSKLPSVTTILSATMPEEKRQSLARWVEREGKKRSDEIKQRSANRGSAMHKILEHTILNKGYADLTDLGRQATAMAAIIAERGLSDINAFYGTEVTVYYPELYAGQTDLAALHKEQDSIIDFKQTNKPKRREWIEDYFLQGAAYCMAHVTIYGTDMRKFVIMMCSGDLYYQEFILEGNELRDYKYRWLKRLDESYKNKT